MLVFLFFFCPGDSRTIPRMYIGGQWEIEDNSEDGSYALVIV